MSLDTFDFSKQAQRLRAGFQPGIYPIILDMTTLAIGAEQEVMISPCDHIWLPTYYDPSMGFNPGQCQPSNITFPNHGSSGPNQNRTTPLGVGQNMFDVWLPQGSKYFQAATIFSLRFNSINAPWLLWGLSMLMSEDPVSKYLVGQGDCMRSITGPIARMWVKKLSSAMVNSVTSTASDRVVMLSSLGYSQVTLGGASPVYDTTATSQGQIGTYATTGGGYTTTQLNTADQQRLEDQKGLTEPGTLK